MSHVVTAISTLEKLAMLNFLHEHDVHLPPSMDFQAFGTVSKRDELMGVVAYNGFWGHVCSMHTAGVGNWITRPLIWRSFDYPFRQLELKAVLAPVAAHNERALKLNRRLGFKDIHVVKDGWDDGDDLIILQMKPEECIWFSKFDRRFAH